MTVDGCCILLIADPVPVSLLAHAGLLHRHGQRDLGLGALLVLLLKIRGHAGTGRGRQHRRQP